MYVTGIMFQVPQQKSFIDISLNFSSLNLMNLSHGIGNFQLYTSKGWKFNSVNAFLNNYREVWFVCWDSSNPAQGSTDYNHPGVLQGTSVTNLLMMA